MSAREEAIGRLAKAAKEAADDWGWKGGKPGEITGGDYVRHMREQLAEWNDISPEPDFLVELQTQLMRSKYPAISAAANDVDRIYRGFSRMEQAGIPRQWTGRVMSAALQSSIPVRPKELSELMRPMTDAQRETFLSLLPRWTGTLEQAASAAKKLYRR